MRIATWNVNGMNARREYFERWLREVEPDVVGLQELKLEDPKFPAEAFEALGYRSYTHGQKSWNGVAVLAKEPCEVRQIGLPGQAEFGSRLIAVEVAGLTFVTVYCPNGKTLEHPDFRRKLGWFDDLFAWLASRYTPDAPLVLCGDFNIVPAALDSWDEAGLSGQIFHTPEERARFARLLDWGFVDLWRARRPSEPGHTWWDYRGGAFHRRHGLRIDLILATPSVAARVQDVQVSRDWRKKLDELTPSDHAPVWADLERGA
jgi:exodeoxyribonuclease-3